MKCFDESPAPIDVQLKGVGSLTLVDTPFFSILLKRTVFLAPASSRKDPWNGETTLRLHQTIDSAQEALLLRWVVADEETPADGAGLPKEQLILSLMVDFQSS